MTWCSGRGSRRSARPGPGRRTRCRPGAPGRRCRSRRCRARRRRRRPGAAARRRRASSSWRGPRRRRRSRPRTASRPTSSDSSVLADDRDVEVEALGPVHPGLGRHVPRVALALEALEQLVELGREVRLDQHLVAAHVDDVVDVLDVDRALVDAGAARRAGPQHVGVDHAVRRPRPPISGRSSSLTAPSGSASRSPRRPGSPAPPPSRGRAGP